MPAELKCSCPECGYIDLVRKTSIVDDACNCPNCGWKGRVSDTVGFATTEQIWDIERVGSVLLRVLMINAAGPLIQCLEFVGLLPRIEDGDFSKEEAQTMRDNVMKKVCEVTIKTVFEESIRQRKKYAKRRTRSSS